MQKLYRVNFVENSKYYKSITVPAQNLTDAYIIVQKNFNAEITSVEMTGAVKTISDFKWFDIIVEYLVTAGTIGDIQAIADLCNDKQREELVNAIWKKYHQKGAK